MRSVSSCPINIVIKQTADQLPASTWPLPYLFYGHPKELAGCTLLTTTGTLKAEAIAQWAPPLPVPVNIELFNLNRSLLSYTYRLASSVSPGASSRTFIAGYP